MSHPFPRWLPDLFISLSDSPGCPDWRPTDNVPCWCDPCRKHRDPPGKAPTASLPGPISVGRGCRRGTPQISSLLTSILRGRPPMPLSHLSCASLACWNGRPVHDDHLAIPEGQPGPWRGMPLLCARALCPLVFMTDPEEPTGVTRDKARDQSTRESLPSWFAAPTFVLGECLRVAVLSATLR